MQECATRDYHIEIINVIDYFCPGDAGLTLFCVLKGDVTVQTRGRHFPLGTGDIQVTGRDEAFRLTGVTENVTIKVTIFNAYLMRYVSGIQNYGFVIEKTGNEKLLRLLRTLITRLAICSLLDNKETGPLEISGYLSGILRLLVLHFKTDTACAGRDKHYSARIAGVMNHIHADYPQPLSLSMMARMHHTSLAYLSRLFTREVGTSFKAYLTQVRFGHCMNALTATDKPLYQIALDNGFTNTRTLTRLFKAKYGVTPHGFRDEYRQGKHLTEPETHDFPSGDNACTPLLGQVHPTELLTLLSGNLSDGGKTADAPLPSENIAITLDPAARAAQMPEQTYVITIGKLDELLKSNIQQQILIIKQTLPLKYIEAHHLIAGDTILPEFVSDEAFPTCSPYNNTDLAISFLKRQDISLLVRINFDDVLQDFAGYEHKLLAFLCHNLNVFGADYMAGWCFICYPDALMQQNPQVFSHHYVRLRNAIKALLPASRIGMFYPFPGAEEEIGDSAFFRDGLSEETDFLGYSANANEHIDFRAFKDTFAESESFVQRRTQAIIQQLKKRDLAIPLFLQTWNTLTGDTRRTNGSFFRGALLLNTLLDLPAEVASAGFWINSQTQNEALKDMRIDISSLALFYIYNTRRPIFHVLYLLGRVRGRILAKGKHYLVTRTGQGYRVLLTHNVMINPYLTLQEHLMKGLKKELNVVISGLESGTYQIKKRVFDRQNGSLYYQFERHHTRYGRDEEMLQWIERCSSPALSVYDEVIDRDWRVYAEMDINAICLFELNRIHPLPVTAA